MVFDGGNCSGNVLAYAGHDSSVHFATFPSAGEPVVRSVRLNDLPLSSLLFLSESALVGGGHDFTPQLFTVNKTGEWSFFGVVDNEYAKANAAAAASPGNSTGVSAARELFKNKTARGQDLKQDSDTLRTVHERPITAIQNACNSDTKVTAISSTSLDGKLVVWNLPQLELNLAALGI